MKSIKVKNKLIGNNNPIFYIAEAGVNHNGSFKIAKKLIDVASDAGADAVKFQSFNTDEIIIPNGPKAKYHDQTVGKKKSWFSLLKSQEMYFKMHIDLIKYCKKKKIIFLSTPYDYKSAYLLNRLKISAFKIASTDNDNFLLLEKIIKFNKPILISTGMTNFEEVKDIISFFKKKNFNQFVLMQCTGNYPSDLTDANLNVIQKYKEVFNCYVGYSDHTLNNISTLVAIGKGAKVIEKHFTIDKKMYGPDHRMSLSPDELKDSIKQVRSAEQALGSSNKIVLKCEIDNRKKLKKSIVTASEIKRGQIIETKNIKIKRPGNGLRPKLINKIVGMRARINIKPNKLFTFKMLKK